MSRRRASASGWTGGHQRGTPSTSLVDSPPGSSGSSSGGCLSDLGPDSDCLECDRCKKWLCLSCVQMKASAYRALNKNPDIASCMCFLCSSCKCSLGLNSSTVVSQISSTSPPVPDHAQSLSSAGVVSGPSLCEKVEKLEKALTELHNELSSKLLDVSCERVCLSVC